MKEYHYTELNTIKAEIARNVNLAEFMKNEKCRLYKKAVRRGYTTRKVKNIIYGYSGKYGNGFLVTYPNYESTLYSVVEYWIKEK